MSVPARDGGVSWVPAFELLLCLVAILLILVLTESPTKATPTIDTLGVYAVTMSWDRGSNDDVDLYVAGPDGNTVYFASGDVDLMHLETDDLGTKASGTYGSVKVVAHTERVIIRGALTGEYVVNIMMYSKNDHTPAHVTVALWRLRGNDIQVTTKSITLSRGGQIESAFRFTLDAHGDVKNVNHLPKDIVTPSGMVR